MRAASTLSFAFLVAIDLNVNMKSGSLEMKSHFS